ncbi:zinc finger protein 106-like isoform X2 [Haliotis rubra]|uniref:zinc finger protein 106-like isoform X2 n=1 Tax=Haliotis rubra TaxID=36100 RepID=UPI001EE546C3|nr:zinc finger protein 106-like isoform X2 [Haliotis rubra]
METFQFTEPSITVTSNDGIPQLHVSESAVSSNSHPLTVSSPVPPSVSGATSCGGGEKHMSLAVSSAVDLGRRALQMSGLEDRQSHSQSCTSSATPSPQTLVPSVDTPHSQHLMSAVLELSLKEEEKQKDIDELERKIDVMRQMLRRTLDHLENSEHRRKELLSDNKKIRERKVKVLRELMGHQSLESPLHTTQLSPPIHAATGNVMTTTRSLLSSESMDIDIVTDCVTSTSQAKPDSNIRIDPYHPDIHSSRLLDQQTEASSQADTASRQRIQLAGDAGKAPESPPCEAGSPSGVTYIGPSDPVTCLQVFKNHIYVCYQGNDIHRYHLKAGVKDMVYNCSYHSVQCMSVVAVPGKEDCIYAGGVSFQLLLFNAKTPHIVQTFELSEEIKCMHYDAGTLYVGLMSGSVEVFEVKNHRHKDSFQCAYQAIHCISSAREGGSKLICVSAQDTTISVCDARSGLPVRILGGHKKTSFSVMSSAHFVFSGSGDRTVMMHNLHTGKLEWTFKEHGGIVTSVWVEGNTLYSAGFDRLVRCFDIKSHTLKKMYYGAGKGVIMSIEVHGDELYTGSREGHVECIQMKSESWPCKIDMCQYVFGVREHLLHHLLTDHVLPNNKLARCMWKDCTDWLTQQRDDRSLESHMRKHLDSLSGLTA